MRYIPLYLIIVLALVACEPDEGPPPDPDTAEPELVPDPDVDEPEVATHEENDLDEVSERRERLREEMREHRRAAARGEAEEHPRGVTGPETDWWHDEALVVELGLDEQQLAAIEQAAAIHREAHRDGRRLMAEMRQRLSRDLDSEARAEIAEERERLQQDLEAADRDWQSAVEDILGPTQFEQLEGARPDAVSPRVERRLRRDAGQAPESREEG